MLPDDELEHMNKALKRMKLKKLEDYYKTERWQTIRNFYTEIFDKCAICNSILEDNDKNLHHMSYRNLGKETVDDVRWLCVDCHEDLHNEVTNLLEGRTSLLRYVFSSKRSECQEIHHIQKLRKLINEISKYPDIEEKFYEFL